MSRISPVKIGLAAVAVAIGSTLLSPSLGDGEAPTGSGLTFRDAFYGMSGAEVRQSRLGPVLAEHVSMMDTTTTIREITGVDPDVAVVADVRDMGGTPAEGRAAWLLLSPDEDLAANPWTAPAVSDALVPPGR